MLFRSREAMVDAKRGIVPSTRGAAFTTSLTELVVLVWLVRMMPRDLLRLASVRVGAKAAAAAALTAIVLIPLREQPLLVTVPLAIGLYAALALATRVVTARELAALGSVVLPLRPPARNEVH